MAYAPHSAGVHFECLLEVKIKKIKSSYWIKQLGSYIPLYMQIYQPQLEWELKPLLTTQVSWCPGNGHVRVCPCVLTLWELTTNLREALGWCTQWTIQQQPVPPCPTSSVTQSIPSGFTLRVVKLGKQVSTVWFIYQQEVCRYSSHTVHSLLM